MKELKVFGFCLLLLLFGKVSAQSHSTTASSDPLIRPIPESDMMYRKTVWRTLDLREKQNKPLFAFNQQISKVIIDAVKRGELPIYKNDSLTSTITLAEFTANMTMVNEGGNELTPEQIEAGFDQTEDEGWGPEVTESANVALRPDEFFPKDLYQLEIKEDAVFDKKRSRMYYDIKAITLVVPATLKTNVKLRDILVGTFKYSDLVKVFRDNPKEARWINPQNEAEHKNLADAFDLRLFSSFITKVSNPDNASLEDMYGSPQQGLLASQNAANQLIEYEYNLWSF